MRDGKRRRFNVLVVWRLDRLGRNLKHLITLLDDLNALGIAFVSLGEGIDATAPAGRLQFSILSSIAEFERPGLPSGSARVWRGPGLRANRSVRKRRPVTDAEIAAVSSLSAREAAAQLGLSKSFIAAWRLSRRLPETAVQIA